MDVGIFKKSGMRLRMWLIIPPLLIVSMGLGSHAWRQRAQWQLQETEALSEILPSLVAARRDAMELFEGFRSSSGNELGSGDELISFLQEMAQQNNFLLDTVNIVDRKKQDQVVPVLNAVVRGRGDFSSIQLYINEAKSRQQLLSVDSIKINTPTDRMVSGVYDVEIVFELMLLNEMRAVTGGGIQ